MKNCSIEGCSRKYSSKGYCRTHYTRFKRTGNPLGLKRPKYGSTLCEVKECTSIAEDKWMCGMHAQRVRRYGDPYYVTPEDERIKRLREAQPNFRKAKPSSYLKHYGRHEHRVIAEQMLGRKLLPGEIVHHRDHNKHNNHPSNLEVMTQSEHIKRHQVGGKLERHS